MNNNVFDELFTKYGLVENKEQDKITSPYRDNTDQRFVRIIAVDETGKFEHIWDNENNKNFSCIGGVYVDLPLFNRDINDVVNDELTKIYEFLVESIEEFNKDMNEYKVVMPDSLHLGNIFLNSLNGEENYSEAELKKQNQIKVSFKKFIEKKTIEFFKKNKYKIFSYILSKNQIDINGINSSNIVDYRVGANLYEEMVISSIENLIFYDAEKRINNISLRMATRVFTPRVDELDLYTIGNRGQGYVTNTNFIKTALMHKIANENINNNNINASFVVESIAYSKPNGMENSKWIQQQKTLSFHYLADITCGILREQIGRNGVLRRDINQNNYEQTLVDAAYRLFNEGYDIRVFSEPDKMYNKMFDYMHAGKIVDYYSLKYDLERRVRSKDNNISMISKFYYDTLLPKLDRSFEEKLIEDKEFQNMIINKIPEFYSQNNGMMGTIENKYEKGMYIALNICNILKVLERKIRSENYKNKYLFRFNDIIIRGYNHRGAISELTPYLNTCNKYGAFVGVEEYLEHKQRSVQVYFNSMNYDKIINEYYGNVIGKYIDGRWNFSHVENMVDSMRIMGGKEHQGFLLVGKIKSTLAQALAFERQKNAEYYFEQAMEEMVGDRGNTDITLSYLLHHYCDMACKSVFDKYKEKFEKKAFEYFDISVDEINVKTLEEVFDKIIGGIQTISELRFSLYLFVKAVNVFYVKEYEHDRDFIALVKKMNNGIINHSNTINDLIHPWELIYKNMYEILDKMNIEGKDFYYSRLVDDARIKANGPTIAAIIIKFKLDHMDDYKIAKDEKAILKDIEGAADIENMSDEDIKDLLDKKLKYMYC